MRNSLPLWLDATILIAALIVLVWRARYVDRTGAAGDWTLTLLLASFIAADGIKFGPVNDALVDLTDPRAVRVAAQLATLVAAGVALAGALGAAGLRKRWGWAYIGPWAVVLCVVDVLPGNRALEIESTDLGLVYLLSYAGAVTGSTVIALCVLLWGWRMTRSGRMLVYASGAIFLLLATGLNAATLAWRAVVVRIDGESAMTNAQKASNGWAFAAFTGFLVLLCVAAGVLSRRRQVTLLGEQLPALWADLRVLTETATLDSSALRPQTRSVRLVLECIEMLESGEIDPSTSASCLEDLRRAPRDRTSWNADAVMVLASRWRVLAEPKPEGSRV